MPRRRPKLISNTVAEATAKKSGRAEKRHSPSTPFVSYVPPPKTEIDRIYDIIDDACSFCWRFTDMDGKPWIEKSDIENKGDGLFVVRFRCPVEVMFSTASFEKMAQSVCSQLNAKLRYAHKSQEVSYVANVKQEFEECIWVIKEGEVSQQCELDAEDIGHGIELDNLEEIQGNLIDESTVEETTERINQALEEFV